MQPSRRSSGTRYATSVANLVTLNKLLGELIYRAAEIRRPLSAKTRRLGVGCPSHVDPFHFTSRSPAPCRHFLIYWASPFGHWWLRAFVSLFFFFFCLSTNDTYLMPGSIVCVCVCFRWSRPVVVLSTREYSPPYIPMCFSTDCPYLCPFSFVLSSFSSGRIIGCRFACSGCQSACSRGNASIQAVILF